MKYISAKQIVIKDLLQKGFNFKKDVFTLTSSEHSIFEKLAKDFKYKESKSSYFGTGSAFYLHLQKIYNKM